MTTSGYDVTGNLVQSTNALGRTTWRQYTALGRLTAETSPLGPLRRRPPGHPRRRDAGIRAPAISRKKT